jgi:hypothetical protein
MSDQQNFLIARAPQLSPTRPPFQDPRFSILIDAPELGASIACFSPYTAGDPPIFTVEEPPDGRIEIIDLETGAVTIPPPSEQWARNNTSTYISFPVPAPKRMLVRTPEMLVKIAATGQIFQMPADNLTIQTAR